MAAVALAAWPVVAEDSLETNVKAAYLYKFAPFVDWPQSAFDGPAAPFVICIAGRDPFGATLERLTAGQKVDGRPIVVRRIAAAEAHSACQILYAGGPTAKTRELLKAVREAPVLTVTDDSLAPGMIDFVLSDGRVRFRIDDEAAAGSGLVISSKLLGLAVSVKPRERSR